MQQTKLHIKPSIKREIVRQKERILYEDRILFICITTRHLLGARTMRKTNLLPNQISNRAPPDYQTGAILISHKLIPSTGQQEFLGYTTLLPSKPDTNSPVKGPYFPHNEYEFLAYKTPFPRRQQYEFTNLYYLR